MQRELAVFIDEGRKIMGTAREFFLLLLLFFFFFKSSSSLSSRVASRPSMAVEPHSTTPTPAPPPPPLPTFWAKLTNTHTHPLFGGSNVQYMCLCSYGCGYECVDMHACKNGLLPHFVKIVCKNSVSKDCKNSVLRAAPCKASVSWNSVS